NIALRFNLVDLPSGRKVHTTAISRVGGIAIFSTFIICIGLSYFSHTYISIDLFGDEKFYYLMAGGFLIFLTGLVDDVINLNAKIKLIFQIIAGSIAYYGGMKITIVTFPFIEYLNVGFLSYPITIFWFLLIINAVNLIDGLDGLAAGVSLLVCLILTLFGCIAENFVVAAAFACLSGSILGFLRYNFNPATIFMGDSGSYFIGYMIAGLSLYGSIKSHTAVTIFVTMLALGIPLADTIIATLRRYMLGKKIFSPDKQHFHHQLLKRGFSHRNAVLFLYLLTFLLCMAAILIVYLNDQKSAIVLLVIALSVIIGVRKLGYFNHLDFGRFIRWTSDIQDGIGLTKGRRQFLAHQLAIHEARDMDEFRLRLTDALKMIDIDYLKLELGGRGCNFKKFDDYIWKNDEQTLETTAIEDFSEKLFISFPIEYNSFHFGRLTASRENFGSSAGSPIILRRLEILRRTISRTLYDIKDITKYNLYDRRIANNENSDEQNQRNIDNRKGERRIFRRRAEDKTED
ncbi:MAG: undecaprenyl/decaprenyl-phosphate alpha-N-acetylglucosaminyl 1-phosphate transferase, partial [Desulfobacteraceae bacterium]|nr:undecaprenyl/decaprenyl-phosphate alpha-N-acetylglucosaminyl 1-phosphate transferase [Desulfobacteraceae bacterium]